MYSDLVQKKKIQRLPPQVFKDWVNILCIANESKPRGNLPPLDDVAFKLHVEDDQAKAILSKLVAYGLLDETEDGYRAHDWDEYQPASDDAADRMSKKRKKEPVQNMFGTSSEQPTNMFALEQSRTDKSRADDERPLAELERRYCQVAKRNTASSKDLVAMTEALTLTGNDPRPILAAIDQVMQRRVAAHDKSPINSFRYFLGAVREIAVGAREVVAASPYQFGGDPLAAFPPEDL